MTAFISSKIFSTVARALTETVKRLTQLDSHNFPRGWMELFKHRRVLNLRIKQSRAALVGLTSPALLTRHKTYNYNQRRPVHFFVWKVE